MTTIPSLPIEILLRIFELATFDYNLLVHTPSLMYYDLSLSTAQSGNPWPAPSEEAEETAAALGRVCRQWQSLAAEFELRHLRIQDAEQAQVILDRLNENSEVGKHTKRITISFLSSNYKSRLWNNESTNLLVELLKFCANLEVFSLRGTTNSSLENWSVGQIILRTLTASCRKLKRLHWHGGYPFDVLFSDLASALASAPSLQALEISLATEPVGMRYPLPRLQFPSLKYLHLCPLSFQTGLASAVAKWGLPSLTSLYCATRGPLSDGIRFLLPKFGGSLRSLSLDANSSSSFPMNHLAGASLEELGIYNVVPQRNRPSPPLQCISTVVVRLVRPYKLNTVDTRLVLDSIAWISKDHFARLDDLVIIEGQTADRDAPSQLAGLVSCSGAGVVRKMWEVQGVQVVNQQGSQIWGMD